MTSTWTAGTTTRAATTVGYEWRALWSLRFVRVVAVVAVVVSGVAAAFLALAMAAVPGARLSQDGLFVVMLRTNMAIPVVALVLSVAAAGADVRRGTALAGILRARGRTNAWVARVLVAGTSAVLLATACTATTLGVVALTAGPVAVGVVLPALGGVVLLALGWAGIGMGAGSVVRHQLAAVVLPVIAAYVVEPLLRTSAAFAPEPLRTVAGRLPFSSGSDLIRGDATTARSIIDSTVGWHVSALVFIGFAVVVAGLGLAVFRRADLVPTDLA